MDLIGCGRVSKQQVTYEVSQTIQCHVRIKYNYYDIMNEIATMSSIRCVPCYVLLHQHSSSTEHMYVQNVELSVSLGASFFAYYILNTSVRCCLGDTILVLQHVDLCTAALSTLQPQL